MIGRCGEDQEENKMAEKYGVVPDRFTKEWWEYFWMYYKWHTIATVFVIIFVAVTIVQCVTKEKFDLTVNCMGQISYSQECLDKAENVCNQYSSDADGNGEVNVFFQQLTITGAAGSEEMDYAVQTKHDMELGNDGSFVFIYDENETQNQLQRDHTAQTYLDVRDWIDGDIDEERLVKTNDGTPIAVKLTASSPLAESGIKTEGLALCVRQNYTDDDFNALSQQSAIELANALIK